MMLTFYFCRIIVLSFFIFIPGQLACSFSSFCSNRETSSYMHRIYAHIFLLQIYKLCGIYLGCGCLAVVMVVVFLDKISLDSDDCDSAKSGRRKQNKSLNLLTSIVQHFWKSKYLKLLAPLTIYSGIEQAFVAGEFTRVRVNNKTFQTILYIEINIT